MNSCLSWLLILILSFGPAISVHASTDSDSDSAPASVTSVLQKTNQAIAGIGTAVYQSQMQVQGLINQMAIYSQQRMGFDPTRGTFQQNAAQLGMAFMTMQECVNSQMQSAKTNIEKKVKKSKDVPADLNAAQIMNSEPVCVNALNLRESAKRMTMELDAISGQVGNCMAAFQRNIDAAIEGIKKPFDHLNQAATESIQTYDQVIENYETAYKKIDNDLEGENGYRKQLKDLEALKLQMNDLLNGGRTKDSSGGVARRLDGLKRARVDAANEWMRTLMADTVSCFRSDFSMICEDDGTPASPEACLMRQVSRLSDKDPRHQPSANAANANNQRQLISVFTQQFGVMRRAFRASDTDVKDPKSFEAAAKLRFMKMNQDMKNILLAKKFAGSVNAAKVQQMADFFSAQMNECFSQKLAEFRAGVKSGGNNAYSAPLVAIDEEEKNILNEVSKVLDIATTQMNDFRTNFTKVFNNDLAQFQSNCVAGGNVYDAVECLKKVDQILDNGIKGINMEGATVMNIPVVKMNGGQAQQGSEVFTCVGFKDCLNVMGKARDFNRDQAQSQKQARTTFAQNHNKTVNAAFGAIAQQFTMNSQLLSQKVTEINAGLKAYGVENTLDMDAVEGETLTIDEKTGLYNPPKNMKAALANKTGFMEIKKGDIQAVQKSIHARKLEIARKGAKAAQMASECEVKASDYKAVMNMLPRCEDAKRDARAVCRSRGATIGALENLIGKSLKKLARGHEKHQITEDLARCLRQDRPSALETNQELEMLYGKSPSDEQRKQFRLDKLSEQTDTVNGCFDPAYAKLRVMNNEESRSPELRDNNNKILGKVEALTSACGDFVGGITEEKADAVIEACKSLKDTSDFRLPREATDDDSPGNPADRAQ